MNLLVALFISFSSFISPSNGEIHLIIEETEVNEGVVQVLLFNNKDGFPSEINKAIKKLSLPVVNKKAEIVLKDIDPGEYAFSVFHDQDMDGEMKKNQIGYPLDKFGFSNNPSLLFGPPSFSKASFKVKDKPVTVKIKLR